MDKIRLLTFSTLFPNNMRPNHGVFVANRLRHLVASGEVTSTVVAPVPWFPSNSPRYGEWSKHAGVAGRETLNGIVVHHPRFLTIPRAGMAAAPFLLYRAVLPFVRRLMAAGERFDAIDAHYMYPDGVAAVWLGRRLGLPTVVTARGTDVNLIPQYRLPRQLIRRAIDDSAALIAVSAALKAAMVELGAPDGKVTVLRNGVDTALVPSDRAGCHAPRARTDAANTDLGGPVDRAEGTSPGHRSTDATTGF